MAHYRVTRQLWARHGFLEEVPDASFLAKGRMACRIYEEELMQDSPGQGGSRKIDCENASGSSLAQNTQGGTMTMKSITYEEFLKFRPCYLHDPEQKALMD